MKIVDFSEQPPESWPPGSEILHSTKLQIGPEIIETIQEDQSSLIGKFALGAKRTVEGAILFAEVTPINEAMRISAGSFAIAKGLDPIGVATVYGGITAIIEGSAAIVAASWLEDGNSKRAINWFNDKLEKRGISPEAKFSGLTKSAIAFLGGSAIVLAVNKRENPENTKAEDRKYGLKVVGLLAGVCAVQGYLVAKGIDAPNPATIGGALLAVSSVAGLYRWAKHRVTREEQAQGIQLNTKEES